MLKLFSLFISTLITGIIWPQENFKKYAWQNDDSALIERLSDRYQFELPASFEKEEIIPSSLQELKLKLWPTLPSHSPQFTKTERKKKSAIEKFLKEQLENATHNAFNREAALEELIKWHPSTMVLLLDDCQLDPFIKNRLSKKDSKTLHALATFFDKSARQFSQKNEPSEHELHIIHRLETKALEIISKIKTLPHINQQIKTNINEHLAWMKKYKPHLYTDYRAMCLPQASVLFPRLKIMPENNGLKDLEPQISQLVIPKKQAPLEDPSIPAISVTPHATAPHLAQIRTISSIASTTLAPITPGITAANQSVEEKNNTSATKIPRSKPKKENSLSIEKEDVIVRNAIDINELASAYKKAYAAGRYQESITKAWEVIKHTSPTSTDFQHAVTRIDMILKMNVDKMCNDENEKTSEYIKHLNPRSMQYKQALERNARTISKISGQEREINEAKQSALYRKILLHKKDTDPSQAISYFMQAQNLRGGKLIEEPEETDPTTFAALTNKLTNIINAKDEEMKDAIAFITSLADNGNQQAIQAIATHHHKTAMANPSMQLLCLRMAFNYLNSIDPQASTVLNGFNPIQIFYDYYQQLYVFAREDENAKEKGLLSVGRYILLTHFLAEAYAGLKMVAKQPDTKQWTTDAEFSFKTNLYKIKDLQQGFIVQFDPCNPQGLAQCTTLIMSGANGVPLSIGQRKIIIDKVKASAPHSTLGLSLVSNTYTGSLYQKAALLENTPFASDYYRMLFDLDTGDFKSALKLANIIAKIHKNYRGELFIQNILLNSDLVPRSDDQKIAHIRNIFRDITTTKKFTILLPTYCDALQIAEEMATRNSVPAIEFLLDAHCANEYQKSHETALITLLNQTRDILRTSTTPITIPSIVSEEFYNSVTYFCGINNSMDPVWSYTGCLLEFIMKSKDHRVTEPVVFRLKQLAEAIEKDITVEKNNSVFFVESIERKVLTDRLRAIVSDKEMIKQLQLTESYGSALNLHWALNPEEKATNAEAQQMAEEAAQELIATFLDPTISLTGHLMAGDGNTDSNLIAQELTDVPKVSKATHHGQGFSFSSSEVNEYVTSPYIISRCRIEDLRKRQDFKLYKKTYGNQKPELQNKEDTRSKIQDLLLLAAHEYMIAQADSAKPVDIFEFKPSLSYIQAALTLHPFYGCLEVANALIDNLMLPSDLQKGYRYLDQASKLAQKHKNKLTAWELGYLESTRNQYALCISTLGLATAFHLYSNTISSTKKVA